MRRLFNLFLVFSMVSAAAYTFEIKRQAEHASDEITRLEHQIRAEREKIELLRADWSVLTQPQRLQDLTERYRDTLNLAPLDVGQIITIGELPNKPIDLSPFQEPDPLGGYAGDSQTNIQ